MSTCDLLVNKYINKSHVNIIMLHVDINKLHADIIMLHVDINKSHVHIIMLHVCQIMALVRKFLTKIDNVHVNINMVHVDINNSHVNIIMLHVDIIYLACRGAEVCHHTILFIICYESGSVVKPCN